jgi:tryptophan-rich sensory protein
MDTNLAVLVFVLSFAFEFVAVYNLKKIQANEIIVASLTSGLLVLLGAVSLILVVKVDILLVIPDCLGTSLGTLVSLKLVKRNDGVIRR